MIFKNWADIVTMDPEGPGSLLLAELIAWQCFSKEAMERPETEDVVETIRDVLVNGNRPEVIVAGFQAMCDMDLTGWLSQITSPALVMGGDQDMMTPWDQGPNGVGQQGIYEGIADAEKYVIEGAGHATIFEATDEHARVVSQFFRDNSRASPPAS